MALSFVPLALVVVISTGYFLAKTKNKPIRYVTYKITLPAFGQKPEDPAKLYSLISQILNGHKSRGPKPLVVLESVINTTEGIRFLITAPLEYSSLLKNHLVAYWPKLSIAKIRHGRGLEIDNNIGVRASQWQPGSIFPSLEDGNLLSLISGSMHGLKDDEIAGWQIILCSAKEPFYILLWRYFYKVLFSLSKAVFIVLQDISGDSVSARQRSINRALKAKSKTNNKPPLKACCRSIVGATSDRRLKALNLAMSSTLMAYGLMPFRLATEDGSHGFIRFQFKRSFPAGPITLSSLFDFPDPGGNWQFSAEAVYSSDVKPSLRYRQSKPEIIIGASHDQDKVEVGLSKTERKKHTLVIGGTGMGKSTLLEYSFVQDMNSNYGAALIDPHGDLANSLIKRIPSERINDVIFIDPSNLDYPVAVNLLEIPKGLDDNAQAMAKDYITESLISIFRKVFSDEDSGGHRIEYILRNVIHTAFSVPDATLFTLQKILTNDLFRTSVINQLKDDSLKDFWYGEFNKAGSYQKVKMIGGVTAKLGRFERSTVAKRMLAYPHSTIDFDEVLDMKKLLICNLSKGSIGNDTSSLLGMVILAKLQLSSWRRAQTQSFKRSDYYLYVDEFQQFSAPIFTQLVSESRKFGLYLTLAEQTTSYQDESESSILLANVGNIVCFRTHSETDVRRLLPLYKPYLNELDLIYLDPYKFYLKSSGEKAKPPVSANTILFKDSGNSSLAKRAITSSHSQYSYPYISSPVPEKDKRIPFNPA